MSASSGMAFAPFSTFRLKLRHQVVYRGVELANGFCGQMRVNRCGRRTLVSKGLLNGAKIDAAFQKRRGVAVAKRVNGHILFNVALTHDGLKRLLKTRIRENLLSVVSGEKRIIAD